MRQEKATYLRFERQRHVGARKRDSHAPHILRTWVGAVRFYFISPFLSNFLRITHFDGHGFDELAEVLRAKRRRSEHGWAAIVVNHRAKHGCSHFLQLVQRFAAAVEGGASLPYERDQTLSLLPPQHGDSQQIGTVMVAVKLEQLVADRQTGLARFCPQGLQAAWR